MKKKSLLVGSFAMSLLGACATVAPEDVDRSVKFKWKIQPETTQSQTLTVDMGDIFFEWKASAHATHEIETGGNTVLLTQASTVKGNVFCSFLGSDPTSCYEDRDVDGQLDHKWQPKQSKRSPVVISSIGSPEEMEIPLSYRATKESHSPSITQKLGLLYDGVQFGNIVDKNTLTGFSGRFLMGWHHGKNIPRTANGVGWKAVKLRRSGSITDPLKPASFDTPGIEVKMISGTADGTANILVDPKPTTGEFEIGVLPNMDLLQSLLLKYGAQ